MVWKAFKGAWCGIGFKLGSLISVRHAGNAVNVVGIWNFKGTNKKDNDRHIDRNINVYKLKKVCPKLIWMSSKSLILKENLESDIIDQGNYKEKEKKNNCSKRITLISGARWPGTHAGPGTNSHTSMCT